MPTSKGLVVRGRKHGAQRGEVDQRAVWGGGVVVGEVVTGHGTGMRLPAPTTGAAVAESRRKNVVVEEQAVRPQRSVDVDLAACGQEGDRGNR